LRFKVTEIRHYYNNLELPEALWKWSRKHYRLETIGCHWVLYPSCCTRSLLAAAISATTY
jgi:hypothetical protein